MELDMGQRLGVLLMNRFLGIRAMINTHKNRNTLAQKYLQN